jgi:hypothetical protein
MKIRIAEWEDPDGHHLTVFDSNFADEDIADWIEFTSPGQEIRDLEITDGELIVWED